MSLSCTVLRRRHRIAKWLGLSSLMPQPASERPANAPLLAVDNPVLAMPPSDRKQQLQLASRYFSYGDDLISRGAADLAAPYFRQAYALLAASYGQEPPHGLPSAALTLKAEPEPKKQQPTASRPTKTATETIHELRKRLSSSTLLDTKAQVAALRAQGIDHPDLDHLAGLTALLSKDPEEAKLCLTRALKADPNHYGSLVSLAGLALSNNQNDEAQRLLSKALTVVNPDSLEALPALTNLSLVHQALNHRMDEALLLLKIHRLKPGHVRDQRMYKAAETLVEMGEDVEAIEILKWLSERPEGNQALQPLASLLERRGDYQAAALVYRRLLQPPTATKN